MGDSPHPPRHRRDSLQPGCRDCSRYPCPRCLSCPCCCCRPCCCCCRCSCCCCCWLCWPRCCCPRCWICWSCHCCSCCCCCSCSCCLSFKNQQIPMQMATTTTFAIQKWNIGLCNPKRPF